MTHGTLLIKDNLNSSSDFVQHENNKKSVLFVGLLMSLFWISGGVCSDYQSQYSSPHLPSSLLARDHGHEFLIFILVRHPLTTCPPAILHAYIFHSELVIGHHDFAERERKVTTAPLMQK